MEYMKSSRVFLIDDDEDILRLYSLVFELNGLTVVGSANNGKKAIEMLQDSIAKPDVIIIDYHMPIMNGIDTAKIISKINDSYKIVMISADPSVKEIANSNGITKFYEKPHNIQELCQKIKDFI
jgi:DNA-binding NtrC family response regulator